MIILIHGSKTMRTPASGLTPVSTPGLLDKASELMERLRKLTPAQLAKVMKISAEMASKTKAQYETWTPQPVGSAAEMFVGDIYSGLQIDSLSAADRRHANAHIRILSGLYGILRPFDGIDLYKLEMGYQFPGLNLYHFWGSDIAEQLPSSGRIVNLAAAEYSKTVTKYVEADRVVTPKFLTRDSASGQPKFVVVHAKIARGCFARCWSSNVHPT